MDQKNRNSKGRRNLFLSVLSGSLKKNKQDILTALIVISQALIASASIQAINASSIATDNNVKMLLNHISINTLQSENQLRTYSQQGSDANFAPSDSLSDTNLFLQLTTPDSSGNLLKLLENDFEESRRLALEYSKRTLTINYVIIMFAFGMINWGVAYLSNKRWFFLLLLIIGLGLHLWGILKLYL